MYFTLGNWGLKLSNLMLWRMTGKWDGNLL